MDLLSRARVTRCAILVLLTAAPGVAAQATGAAHVSRTGGRTLGGHTFPPLSTVPGPFVGTSLASTLGGAVAFDVVESIVVDVGGQLDTLRPSGDLAFGTAELIGQLGLSRRFAVRASAAFTARTGTNARMIFAEGLSGSSSFTLGGLAALHRGERSLVTATLDLRRGSLATLSPRAFAEYVAEWGLDSLEHWNDHLLVEARNARVVVGVRGAWAPRPWLGVSGMVEGGPANLYVSGSPFAVTTGLGGSLDFTKVKWRIPVNLAIGLGWSTAPSNTDLFRSVGTTNVGLYYTPGQDFAFGVDLRSSTAGLRSSDQRVRVSTLGLVMRYDL
jgi:hypothetical protein